MTTRMSWAEFVVKGIVALREPAYGLGINPSMTGLNSAIVKYGKQFDETVNPIEITKALKEQGVIDIIGKKDKNGNGYVRLYVKGDLKAGEDRGDKALALIEGRKPITIIRRK